MDNADLEKLLISPGKLSPKFHKDTLEYCVIVGSDVSELKVDPWASDNNASYSISGSGGSKKVPLKEGDITAIKIEVSSEDGTIKNYFINATRLSASDASLTDIKCSCGTLSPPFSASVTNYALDVSCYDKNVTLTPSAADTKVGIKLVGNENMKDPVALNYGETLIEIEVVSPDKENTQVYKIIVSKQQILRPVKFCDSKKAEKYQCPACLGVLHRPKSILNSSPKHVFCKSCLDELTKTSKQDPLDDTPLPPGDWRIDEYALDKEMSSEQVQCLWSGCAEKVVLGDLCDHIKQCECRLVMIEKTGELVSGKDKEAKEKESGMTCPDCSRSLWSNDLDNHQLFMCSVKHPDNGKYSVELRGWEKKLRQDTSETSSDKLVEAAQKQEQIYLEAIAKYGAGGHYSGENLLQYLDSAAEFYSTAIKIKPKDAKLHFHLAQVLEEQFIAEDVFGIKPEKPEFEEFDFNKQSKDSSKEDDIQAICEMRGVGRNAPLVQQLKAIDEEYHHVMDQQQSDKSDYLQQLYAWKSKQATQEGKAAQKAADEQGALGKAYLKYLDALACSSDNYLYHLHVGRMLVLQGKYEDAINRLQIALGLKPTIVESRFYLGLAMCQQKEGIGKRLNEAASYLNSGLQFFLHTQSLNDSNIKNFTSLIASQSLRHDNVQVLRGFTVLGNQLAKLPSKHDVMSASDAYHTSSLLASHARSRMGFRGDTYQQIEWVLLEAHSQLLQVLIEEQRKTGSGDTGIVARRCDVLSALIKCSSLPPGNDVLELQEKTCQQCALLQPSNSRTLHLLGNAQLRHYDNNPDDKEAKDLLKEAEGSFRASIEQEGKPSNRQDIPPQLAEQRWWKEKKAKEEAEKKAKAAAQEKSAPTKPGASPARGGARGRGASTPGRGATSGKTTTPSSRGGPATRGGATPTRGGTTGGRGTARGTARGSSTAAKSPASKVSPVKSTTSVKSTSQTSANCSHPASKSPSPSDKKEPTTPLPTPAESTPASSGPPNKSTYHARLGLARVLSRASEDLTESHKLYNDVITMETQSHDAYIELGESLAKKEPMNAVDVYSKFPFPETLTFDDSYIHGEIVRLLMKHEKFDDSRLGPSMTAMGKVMGFTVIEKYVDILDSKFKYSSLLKKVYAGVNGKDENDPDLQAFFKFKCWI